MSLVPCGAPMTPALSLEAVVMAERASRRLARLDTHTRLVTHMAMAAALTPGACTPRFVAHLGALSGAVLAMEKP